MSDVFLEFMVHRKNSGKAMFIKMGALLGGALVAFLIILLAPLLGVFSMIGYLVAAGAVYGGWKLYSMQNLEYEYIITNGDMDVDKIINRNSRKRMISVKCQSFDALGKYDPKAAQGQSCKSKFFACSDPSDSDVWYATFSHATHGQTMLVFNANERMLEAFRRYIPKTLAYEVFVKGARPQ